MNRFTELIKERLDQLEGESNQEGWIILYNGKQLVMPSGKRIWSSKRHASCALSNAMYSAQCKAYREGLKEREYGDAYRELEEQGVLEFKKLI